MTVPNDITNALPRRHPKEPRQLRQDIFDEIADHLSEATQRELQRGAESEAAAKQRALKTFGNPADVARRLWWDAMKETVMKEWIQTAIMGAMSTTILVMLGFMYMQSRQQQAFMLQQMALLENLRAQSVAPPGNYRNIEIHANRGTADGPPAKLRVQVTGPLLTEGQTASIEGETNDSGIFVTDPVRINQHNVTLTDQESRLSTNLVLSVFPGLEPLRKDVVVPEFPNPIPLHAAIASPADLWNHVAYFAVECGGDAGDGWYWTESFCAGPDGLAPRIPLISGQTFSQSRGSKRLYRFKYQFGIPLNTIQWTDAIPCTGVRPIEKLVVYPVGKNGHVLGDKLDIPNPIVPSDGQSPFEIVIPDDYASKWGATFKEIEAEPLQFPD